MCNTMTCSIKKVNSKFVVIMKKKKDKSVVNSDVNCLNTIYRTNLSFSFLHDYSEF